MKLTIRKKSPVLFPHSLTSSRRDHYHTGSNTCTECDPRAGTELTERYCGCDFSRL